MQHRRGRVSEIEEAAKTAERIADEIGAPVGGTDERRELADALRRTARSLRLALVAEAEPSIMNRVELRLETLLRRASELELALALELEAEGGCPLSQRPTVPPPLGMAPDDVWEREIPSERPTVRPVAASGAPSTDPPRASLSLRPDPRRVSSGVVSKVEEPPSSARSGAR